MIGYHTDNCPIYLAQNGRWGSSIQPQCTCVISNEISNNNQIICECSHLYLFLHYSSDIKNKPIFYCQKCLKIEGRDMYVKIKEKI